VTSSISLDAEASQQIAQGRLRMGTAVRPSFFGAGDPEPVHFVEQ